jgi:hypothetical protein
MLPDLPLLKIFGFYVCGRQIHAWHTLVHVCRKWRKIVFGSKRRLNLRLFCNAKTSVREMLDIWPPLPIAIRLIGHEMRGGDNISEALELSDRVCGINFTGVPGSQLENFFEMMRQPFPVLTNLSVFLQSETAPVIPASFLGGSAPRLQTLFLTGIGTTKTTFVCHPPCSS